MRCEFSAALWRWEARPDLWVFVTLPLPQSQEIADVPRPRAGFGAVPVRVRCGTSTWTTSIFPGEDGAYVLPLKKAVREAQGLELGDVARFSLELLG